MSFLSQEKENVGSEGPVVLHSTLRKAEYYPIEFETNIECLIFRAIFENERSKIFCVIERPQSFKLNHIIDTLETQ